MISYVKLYPYATGSFLYYGFIGCFISYVAIFLTSRDVESSTIGIVFALFTCSRVLLGFLFAYLSDIKQDRLFLYRVGIAIASIFLVISLCVTSQFVMLFCVVVSVSFFSSTASLLELLCLDAAEQNTIVYNRIRLLGSFGFVVCAIAMGMILEHFDEVSILFCGISVLCISFVLSGSMKNGICHIQQPSKRSIECFVKRCNSAVFIAFLVSSILLHISLAPFIGFFTQYLMLNNYSGGVAGVLFSIGALAEMVMFFFAGSIILAFNVRTLLIFGFLITACRWYLQGLFIEHATVVILTQLIHAFTFGLMHSVSVHFLNSYFPVNHQVKGQFMYFGACFGIGTGIGSWITGITWDNGQGSELTYLWAASCCLFAAAMILLVPAKKFQL